MMPAKLRNGLIGKVKRRGQAITPLRAEDHSNAHPAAETPVEGRQGFLGRAVLAVLIGGLLLVGLAWIIVHYATR